MGILRRRPDNAAFQAQQDALNKQVTHRLLDGDNRFDHWLIRWSDYLSPIVVKESRQALRSKQFLWTFGFLLACIIGWTFLTILSRIPSIYYYPAGASLLSGYIIMLAVPALVIIPIAAFFSMASELNSNTFEVLSISPLSAHKIVFGKVVVAGVQLLLYFSALAPCIALTYLLRGVSLNALIMIFPIVAIISFLVISISIMLATFCRTVFHNVLFLLVQLFISGIALIATTQFIFSLYYSGDALISNWQGIGSLLGILFLIASYGVLAILVGGASIGIAGENYSRSIRLWLALQGICLFWICLFELPRDYSMFRETLSVTLVLLALHWGAAGIFIVSESGLLSIRAQRSLAGSYSSRLLGVWLNPGGGTGYMFVILNFAACSATLVLLMFLTRTEYEAVHFVLAVLSYLALYLGLLRLVMIYIPKSGAGRAALPALLAGLLLSIGSGGPLFLSLYLSDFRGQPSYEAFCFISPFWTLLEFQTVVNMTMPLTLLYFTTLFVFCLNAVVVSGDVTLVRVKSPEEIDLDLKQRTIKAKTEDPFAVE